jgi:hypothetical protein
MPSSMGFNKDKPERRASRGRLDDPFAEGDRKAHEDRKVRRAQLNKIDQLTHMEMLDAGEEI